MSDGVLSTSAPSLAGQILATQQEVKVLQKSKEIQEDIGEGQQKLLDSLPAAQPEGDPLSPVGYNLNVKA